MTVSSDGLDITLMRGGSSRGPVVRGADLPADPMARDALLIRLIGLGRSQLDGVGGGSPISSKVVVVSPPGDDADADLHYQVGNVAVGAELIDWSGTCGNMTAAVPLYAWAASLPSAAGRERFRLRNLSTKQLIDTELLRTPQSPGEPATVRTTYLDPVGGVLGSLLPTGNPIDRFEVDGIAYEGSLLDVTHPYLFLDFDAIAPNGAVDSTVGELVERIRSQAAVRVGAVRRPEDAATESAAVPRAVLVHPKRDAPDELRITAISMGTLIGSAPVTASMCARAAAGLPGTLVARVWPHGVPSGALRVVARDSTVVATADIDASGTVRSAGTERTTRIIVTGRAFVG